MGFLGSTSSASFVDSCRHNKIDTVCGVKKLEYMDIAELRAILSFAEKYNFELNNVCKYDFKTYKRSDHFLAYFLVHSDALASADFLLVFQC